VRENEAEEKDTTRKNFEEPEEGEKWTNDPNRRRTCASTARPGEKSQCEGPPWMSRSGHH
jgi:hypothetical protein